MALRADDVDLGRDHDLVVRSQSGDDDAFEDLYRRYFERLYRFCLRRIGDPHEAEELAQEAFVRAYGALPRLGGERRFYPWLSVIASRLCVDAFRRRARIEPAPMVDRSAGDDGSERVLQAVDAELLGTAFRRLTPRHREALALREHEGWSYQHIAEHYEVSIGTVEALLHRARRALRREFDALAGGDARRAAGLPVLGWLARRLDRARSRVAGWETAWTPVIGHAMAVTVVAVGSAMGGVAASGGSPVVLPTSPIAAVRPAPTPAPTPVDAPTATRTVGRQAAASPGPAEQPAAAPVAAASLPTGTSVEHGPEAKKRAGDGPTGVDEPSASATGDPKDVAHEAAEAVDNYIIDQFRDDH